MRIQYLRSGQHNWRRCEIFFTRVAAILGNFKSFGVSRNMTLVANYLLCIESFALDGDFKLRKIRTSSSTAVEGRPR
jgi:hypothetical protein